MAINKVMILGGGTMGLDIAQVFAKAGKTVIVRDISDEIIDASEARLIKTLDKLVAKGKMEQEARDELFGRVSFTVDMAPAADADLILEAAVENLAIKQSIFKELDEICKPECYFATNTSSISITAIGAVTKRKEKFIGMHFFNPATVMKLVEVIRSANTSDETFHTIFNLAIEIGKSPIQVNEAHGFVVNRLLIPMINEASMILGTGVASAEDIDNAMKLGANFPMGPLALGDLIGIDVCVAIMDVMFQETGDSKYRCSPILRKMARGGLLGRKTGEGFFVYDK